MKYEKARPNSENLKRSRAPYAPRGSAHRKRRKTLKLSPRTISALRELCRLDKRTQDFVITSAVSLYALESQGVSWSRQYFDGF